MCTPCRVGITYKHIYGNASKGDNNSSIGLSMIKAACMGCSCTVASSNSLVGAASPLNCMALWLCV